VTPGYVKCPKCHMQLPSNRRAGTLASAGGTAVEGQSRPPVLAFIVGGAVALGIVLFFALRKGDSGETVKPPDPAQTAEQPVATPTTTDPTTLPDPTPAGSAAPDPKFAINALDRALKKERLWSTVQAVGTRVDVRSGACSDPGMAPILDANAAPLRDVGLTRLRCLEQGGAVVFERDL
jgi:hypothetical protein